MPSLLVSDVIQWVWTHQGGEAAPLDRVAALSRGVPNLYYQDRSCSLVNRILDAENDQHLRLELMTDLKVGLESRPRNFNLD